MTKASLRILIAVLTATGGIALWLFLRPGSGGTTPDKSRSRIVVAAPITGAARSDYAPMPEFGTDAFKKFALERCGKWLESRNRDAGSLVAMWDLTGDESFLDEAAKKFPNDPKVCVAMIDRFMGAWGASRGGDPAPWLDRLIAAEPGNPAGYYWRARFLAISKKPGEALEALRAATGIKGGPDIHLHDRMVTIREAFLAGGATIREAASAAYTAPGARDGQIPAFAGSLGTLLNSELEAAKAAGDKNRYEEIASLGAACGEHLSLNRAPTFIDDLVRATTLRGMLKKLDPETEFGNNGKTVAGRLQEVETELADFQTMSKNHPNLLGPAFSNLTDSQASEYMDRFILQGESSATRWLISDMGSKSKAPEGSGGK